LQYWGRSNTHQHWFAVGLRFGQKFFNVAFCSYLHLQYFNWAAVPGRRISNSPTSQSPIVACKHIGQPTIMELDNFKYNLSRLKKCDQYWDEMNPVLGGRLCNKCDKKIIDFSNMTFTDIAIYMSESKEPVCGFYRPEQLKQFSFSKSKLPIAVSLTTLLTTSTISKAQKFNIQTEQNVSQNKSVQDINIETPTLNDELKTDTVYFIGNVQYFDTAKQINLPVSFATVIIKGTRNGVATMDNGDFKLRHLPTTDSGKIYLVISSVGFETKEIEIAFDRQKEIKLENIIINKYRSEITEFWVSTKKRSRLNRFWRKITKPFR
jgi:CarboxypepD_reg-like domain